jgi:hypothetical protein
MGRLSYLWVEHSMSCRSPYYRSTSGCSVGIHLHCSDSNHSLLHLIGTGAAERMNRLITRMMTTKSNVELLVMIQKATE